MKPAPLILCSRQEMVVVIDHVSTGKLARMARETAKISLREVARRMKKSAQFISHLERGMRSWTEQRACDYMKALKGKPLTRKEQA